MTGYLYFWGAIFMVVTTLVAIFKHENSRSANPKFVHIKIVQTYKLLFRIMKLSNVKNLVIILFTIQVKVIFEYNLK